MDKFGGGWKMKFPRVDQINGAMLTGIMELGERIRPENDES